jgi:F0F1-type ATP synthase membrane subunit b/b'
MSSAILIGLLAVAAGAEHAAKESTFNGWGVAAAFFNWVLCVGTIAYFAGPKIKDYLRSERDSLASQLREAKKKQAEADERLASYQHKLEHLEEEVAGIIKSFEAQGEADRERFKAETERAVDRLVREVDFTIKQESLAAQKAIRAAAVDTTLNLAESLVRDRITDADKRRLADEYVGALDKNGA